MNDDTELDTPPDEPSPEDFEAADEEAREARPAPLVVRIARAVAVVLVVLALVAYFAVPVRVVIERAYRQWRGPNSPFHSIPLAPQRPAPPRRT